MFGSYLRAAREKARLSQADAAAAVGIGADAIYRYERDANSPSMEVLDKLASAYGVLPGDLLPNSGGDVVVADLLQPLVAALAGMTPEDMRDQVLILASQARLNRNAILRYARNDASHTSVYTPAQTLGKADELRDVPVPSADPSEKRPSAPSAPVTAHRRTEKKR